MTTQAPETAEVGAWMSLLRAHAALTRELSSRLETGHGLTLSDYDVLAQIYHEPSRRMRRVDIARQVLLSPSGITRLLDGLERAGWVCKVRCSTDARVVYASMTDEGVRKFEEARKQHHRDLGEVFGSRLTLGEHENLAEILGRLPLAETSQACSGDHA